ncbi:MAG TPA: hypothetical protein VNV38_11235 [Stellaceae bacterium]|nr:hypothetical protein [Stellaceae bacterium]
MSNNEGKTNFEHVGGGLWRALGQILGYFKEESGLSGVTGIVFVVIFFGIEGVIKKFIDKSLDFTIDIIAITTLISGLIFLFISASIHMVNSIVKARRLISKPQGRDHPP